MKQIIEKEKCTGCTACMSICPKKAITMLEDNNGFKYPIIDETKCVNCGLCKRTCPVLNTKSNKSISKCFVGYCKNETYKENSSSGGIFPLIANYILDNKGIVIGAAFNNENKLEHIAISTANDLDKLKSAKYLQSDMKMIFSYIKENLNRKKILFVGTPCQVAGLKSYVRSNLDNLFCIDLVCHGVPSPKLFKKYINELEKKYNTKVLRYNFRDKSSGWDTYSNTIVLKNSKYSENHWENDYMNLFLSNISLRDSCFNCNFKIGNKYSDITLGDFWGVKNYYPEMYNKKGVSAIIINTTKGEKLFNNVIDEINYKECKLEEIIDGNPSLKYSSNEPKNRTHFFKDLNHFSIKYLSHKYIKRYNFIKKIKRKIKKIIKNF